ncbi:McrC family protein [Halogeometricum sp. S1BR25-6]|uniref:McrC family protein n=1 Tax=Halogeometricum salsisoli TaxID=2950536 RepID=A0ABU2GJJ0_9EURY|nr:restriction endonuclease [Halogeometricum sp. S1BR25-6]MDS0300944.1 McrC family protein [Halogeometricum sp. S1BR25-6]
MSTALTRGQHSIREKREKKFVPADGDETFDTDRIARQLTTVGFERSGATFEKSQQVLLDAGSDRSDWDGEPGNPTVLTVTLSEEALKIEAKDVVGIVTLLPGVTIEIEPKIGWNGLIDMLLTVLDVPAAEEPYTMPTGTDDERSVDPADVIVLLAINYHRGIDRISRQGLIRDIIVERSNSYRGTGTIDLGQTLRNHAKGEPVPNWIRSRPEYNNPVNSLLHFAGKQLLYFLKQEVSEARISDRRIVRVFNDIYDDLKYLERHGITSKYSDLGEYARVSTHSLPRQRRYYQRALYVAQSLLTSSLFGRGDDGPQRLHIDYVLKMEPFFEDYSHAVLERAVDQIREQDPIGVLDDITCVAQKRIRPFKKLHGQNVHHRPDHLLMEDERTIAVLDSKYYQEGSNPARESKSRSRLFTYAYLQQTGQLAFLCPLATPWSGTVAQTDAEVAVVTPTTDEFNHEAYQAAVQGYVRGVLFNRYPELEVFELLEKPNTQLCIDGRLEAPFEFLYDTDEGAPFSIARPDWFADDAVRALVRSTSVFRTDLEGEGQVLRRRLKSVLTREDENDQRVYPQHEITCIPVYRLPEVSADSDNRSGASLGRLTLFFLQRPDEAGEPTMATKEEVWIR